jgi:hypothetical protein
MLLFLFLHVHFVQPLRIQGISCHQTNTPVVVHSEEERYYRDTGKSVSRLIRAMRLRSIRASVSKPLRGIRVRRPDLWEVDSGVYVSSCSSVVRCSSFCSQYELTLGYRL